MVVSDDGTKNRGSRLPSTSSFVADELVGALGAVVGLEFGLQWDFTTARPKAGIEFQN